MNQLERETQQSNLQQHAISNPIENTALHKLARLVQINELDSKFVKFIIADLKQSKSIIDEARERELTMNVNSRS